MTLEQGDPEFVLQQAQPGRDIGLNGIEADGGTAHAAGAGDRFEDPEVPIIHHDRLSGFAMALARGYLCGAYHLR
ncbi:MAG: hypothetical protein WDN49_06455 [Acetobacteraceae bacterium]